MLESVFNQLVLHYTNDAQCVGELWHELLKKYGNRRRHYHNLSHLEHMYQELAPVKSNIEDWNTVLFALFYHDAVYNPLRRDNEAESAKLALLQLCDLLPFSERFKCSFLILATAGHEQIDEFNDSDTDFFLDADLAIFGQAWDTYAAYAKNIRKEYAVYPDFLYNRGRKDALWHFLQREQIFKTQQFFEKYEKQARLNLGTELKQLKY